MRGLEDLPAGRRICKGLDDLARGERTLEALWMAPAAPRLRQLGLTLPADAELPPEPELALYELLCDDRKSSSDDSYYRYNALRRELDSFVAALEARVLRQERARETPNLP